MNMKEHLANPKICEQKIGNFPLLSEQVLPRVPHGFQKWTSGWWCILAYTDKTLLTLVIPNLAMKSMAISQIHKK